MVQQRDQARVQGAGDLAGDYTQRTHGWLDGGPDRNARFNPEFHVLAMRVKSC